VSFSISDDLRAFIVYLKEGHIEALAREYMRRVYAYDLPMLRLVAAMPEEQQLALNIASLDNYLGTLLDGTALEVAAEGLRRWERDEIPGFKKTDFEPRDLVLVGAAHEGAIVSFLDDYTDDRGVALGVTRELRAHYLQSELNAYEVFTRIRDEAVELAARAEAAREADQVRLMEVQALNEELVAGQEELSALYEQLQEHSKLVEREVARRTEELQSANEELEAHHEELLAANEQLNSQATELATQKAFVEDLVRHMPTGIAYLDRELVFRWVNPEFAAFASKDVRDFVGQSYYIVFPMMENPNRRLLDVIEGGEPARVLGLSVGEQYWDIVYVPIAPDGGPVEGLVLMAQDATARVRNEQLKQAQIEQLQEIDRLKNDFLGILSHELRTPVNAIMGFASILDDEVSGPLNADQHRYAQRILGGSEVLLNLIEDLLDMSRIQAGKFSLSPSQLEPRLVLEDAVGALTQLAEHKRQRIELAIAPDLAPIQADRQRLRQVVTNLVGNAIKFGAEGDVITVRASSGPEGFRCEVEDHGDGIAAEDIPKLFQRFTQLDTGNTRKAGGAGLGLSIVKALVEAHGGAAGVRSEPGVRTVFWFTLPGQARTALL
jgi:two-component system CheB/CheR fusion protein